jgi:uncharacterized protein (DUF1501 family)
MVPRFIADTARAATPGKDNVLVVVELSGGNDGLNTVIPYADDLYHKARPTLRYKKDQVIRLDDFVGLHPGLQGLQPLLQNGQLAVIQGVGYPNPDHSHFEAMDIWQSADPKRVIGTGWLGRAAAEMNDRAGNVHILHIGPNRLPRALTGAPGGGAVSVNDQHGFRLELGGGTIAHKKERRRLVEELAASEGSGDDGDLLSFVRRQLVRTLSAAERLRELLEGPNAVQRQGGGLTQKLQLVAGLIAKGFGTRMFYVSLDGFDTHADQGPAHTNLLTDLGNSVGAFFQTLKMSGHDSRVRLLTFSEFGRRVQENGSKGTDHGSGSCLFLAGAGLKNSVIGKHPSLADLDAGDLRFHTDFRRVYATLLDGWLGCDSKAVLGAKWEHVKELATKS